jgi:hypothetical protein
MLFEYNVCEINMHRRIHVTMTISCKPTPCFRLCFIFPLCMNQPFYLLGDPASFVRGANAHPLLSPWLAINCSPLAASPTPRHPIDQVTYLHRQHQQHQPSHLIQECLLFVKQYNPRPLASILETYPSFVRKFLALCCQIQGGI